MTLHPLDHDDLRRVALLIRAFDATCDTDPHVAVVALERAHLADERELDLLGDPLLAREIWHAGIVLEALARALHTGRRHRWRRTRSFVMAVPWIRTVARAPLRACSVPGCPNLAVLWRCEHHDLETWTESSR